LTDVAAQATFDAPGRPLGFPIERPKIMNWETPSFVEIDMSAEIGSYQGEDDNGL
jgi:coenzyme PQQ precursor peptide PqqA